MAVSDRTRLGADGEDRAFGRLLQWAAVVASAGVDLIQIRERGLSDRRLQSLVAEVLEATRSTKARVLVNERTDVALAVGASGVHLPSSAPPCERVRELTPAGFVIGRSIHATDQSSLHDREVSCDYLLFGTVFTSSAKAHGQPIAGVAALQAACDAATRPVLAIGGVDVARTEEAARAGAAGIAAIGMFADPLREGDAAEHAMTALVAAVRQAFERGARTRWTRASDHR